jgi:hypothetical protein
VALTIDPETADRLATYQAAVMQGRLPEARPTTPTSGGGVKHDCGKPPLGLLPWRALVEVAEVLDHGAKKYTRHNWRGGFQYSRLYDAALRHLTAFIEGQDNDEETGISHLAHLSCCTLFLLTQVLEQKPGLDDRYKPPSPPDHPTIYDIQRQKRDET